MAAFDQELQDKVNQTAQEFSKSLVELAFIVESKFSQVVRKTVLDLYANIIRRSPVDTGTYRASHSIANHDPSPEEGIVYLKKDKNKSEIEATASIQTNINKPLAWSWKVGDGTIYIFNNLPYAEPLENGHSGQAPQGIYRQALTEVQGILAKQIAELKAAGYFK